MHPSQRSASSEVRLKGRRRFKEHSAIAADRDLTRDDKKSSFINNKQRNTATSFQTRDISQSQKNIGNLRIDKVAARPSKAMTLPLNESSFSTKVNNDPVLQDQPEVNQKSPTDTHLEKESNMSIQDNIPKNEIVSRRITTSKKLVNNTSRENYLHLLAQQIQDQKERKQREKEQQDVYDKQKALEISSYNPWGRPGGGAPLLDEAGRTICNLKRVLSSAESSRNSCESSRNSSESSRSFYETSRSSSGVNVVQTYPADSAAEIKLEEKKVILDEEYGFLLDELHQITERITQYRKNCNDIHLLRKDLSSSSMLLRMYQKK